MADYRAVAENVPFEPETLCSPRKQESCHRTIQSHHKCLGGEETPTDWKMGQFKLQ